MGGDGVRWDVCDGGNMKESIKTRVELSKKDVVLEFDGIYNGSYESEDEQFLRFNIVFLETGEIRQKTVSLDFLVRKIFSKQQLSGIEIVKK